MPGIPIGNKKQQKTQRSSGANLDWLRPVAQCEPPNSNAEEFINVMKLYYVSLTFHYTKKKKNIYEKFRGPFEHAPGAPPLKSASDDPTPRQAIIDPMFNQQGNPRIKTRRMISESTLDETVNRRRVERVGPLEVAGLNERLTIFNSSSGSSVRITFYQSLEQRRGGKPALTARLLR